MPQEILIGPEGQSWATTHYGPRTTNKTSPSARPMSFVRRQIVLQLDGSIVEAHEIDLNNDTLWAFVKGDLVTDVYVYSDTGATVALSIEDGENAVAAAVPAAQPGSWGVLRDVDIGITERSQIAYTIGADETAYVIVSFLQAEPLGDGGVLHRNREDGMIPTT